MITPRRRTVTRTIVPVAVPAPDVGWVLVAQPNQEVYRGGGTVIELPGETMATAEGFVRRLTRRLTESPEARDAEELDRRGRQHRCAACHAIAGAAKRSPWSAPAQRGDQRQGLRGRGSGGVVRRHRHVMLVWLGQRRIPGIDCGRTLRVSGRLGMLDNGVKAIYNPHYEIQR